MRTKNVLFTLLISSLLFVACKKDETTPATATDLAVKPVEAKVLINTSTTMIEAEKAIIDQSEGIQALNDFNEISYTLDLNIPFNKKSSEQAQQKALLSKVYANLPKKGAEVPVLMAGTYTYNPDQDEFDIELGVPSDKIIILYPTKGSNTNNATLTFHEYNVGMTFEKGIFYNVQFDIVVDGITKLKQTINLSINNKFEIEIVKELQAHVITLAIKTDSVSSAFHTQILKSGVSIMELKQEAQLNEFGEPIGDITVYAQIGGIYLSGTFPSGMLALSPDDVSPTFPDKSAFNLTLFTYPGNLKVAKVYLTIDSAFAVYNDGSEAAINSLFDSIGEIFLPQEETFGDSDFEEEYYEE